MPNYKLIYFNLTSFGEPLRFLFHQCGLEFKDDRIGPENWSYMEPENFSTQLPVLEIDGKSYYQYKAIARKIAKSHNLYGSNEDHGFLIDRNIDTFDDLTKYVGQYYWEEDEERRAKLKLEAQAKVASTLHELEEQVIKNQGFLVDGKLSWADLLIIAQVETIAIMLETKVLENYPELSKLDEKVRELPRIKAYLDDRIGLRYER